MNPSSNGESNEGGDDDYPGAVVAVDGDKKRKWGFKKPKDAPSRPLSAYNFFFKRQRQAWLNDYASSEAQAVGTKALSAQATHQGKTTTGGGTPRRFEAMAKAMGARWKVLPPSERRTYIDLAQEDQVRYHREMNEYRDKIIRESTMGAAYLQRKKEEATQADVDTSPKKRPAQTTFDRSTTYDHTTFSAIPTAAHSPEQPSEDSIPPLGTTATPSSNNRARTVTTPTISNISQTPAAAAAFIIGASDSASQQQLHSIQQQHMLSLEQTQNLLDGAARTRSHNQSLAPNLSVLPPPSLVKTFDPNAANNQLAALLQLQQSQLRHPQQQQSQRNSASLHPSNVSVLPPPLSVNTFDPNDANNQLAVLLQLQQSQLRHQQQQQSQRNVASLQPSTFSALPPPSPVNTFDPNDANNQLAALLQQQQQQQSELRQQQQQSQGNVASLQPSNVSVLPPLSTFDPNAANNQLAALLQLQQSQLRQQQQQQQNQRNVASLHPSNVSVLPRPLSVNTFDPNAANNQLVALLQLQQSQRNLASLQAANIFMLGQNQQNVEQAWSPVPSLGAYMSQQPQHQQQQHQLSNSITPLQNVTAPAAFVTTSSLRDPMTTDSSFPLPLQQQDQQSTTAATGTSTGASSSSSTVAAAAVALSPAASNASSSGLDLATALLQFANATTTTHATNTTNRNPPPPLLAQPILPPAGQNVTTNHPADVVSLTNEQQLELILACSTLIQQQQQQQNRRSGTGNS